MSSQTGIVPSEQLKECFSNAEPKLRAIKVIIKDEKMTYDDTIEANGNWEADCKIDKWLVPAKPCYILYRLDTKKDESYDWLLLNYVPDDSKVRDKMLYAATRATLTKILGDSKFVGSIYASTKEELTVENIKSHKIKVDLPLTLREKEMKELNRAESENDISITTRGTVAPSVAFPLTKEALEAFEKYKNDELSFIQLYVNESIGITEANNNCFSINDICQRIVSSSPCFIFMKFKHNYNESEVSSTIFVYFCPESAKIKEKMTYSSARNTIVNYIESEFKIKIGKKIEVSHESDLDENSIIEDLHRSSSKSPINSPMTMHRRPAPPGRMRRSKK